LDAADEEKLRFESFRQIPYEKDSNRPTQNYGHWKKEGIGLTYYLDAFIRYKRRP